MPRFDGFKFRLCREGSLALPHSGRLLVFTPKADVFTPNPMGIDLRSRPIDETKPCETVLGGVRARLSHRMCSSVSSRESQLPHIIVNSFFTITD